MIHVSLGNNKDVTMRELDRQRTSTHIRMHEKAAMSPYELGRMDAAEGLLCVPEMYYRDRSKIYLYTLGYQDVAGPTITTEYILGAEPDADGTPSPHPLPWE